MAIIVAYAHDARVSIRAYIFSNWVTSATPGDQTLHLLAPRAQKNRQARTSRAVYFVDRKLLAWRQHAEAEGFLFGSSFRSLAGGSLWIHDILEFGASGELGHGACRDFERSACARVFTGAGSTFDGFKGSKADQSDGVALFHGGLDGVNEGVQNTASSHFGQFVLGNQFFDEFSAVHM
jgi:hypothetical protein